METPEEIQARHRKELRDLQSRITQKKKSATKKTRKGVNTECEELERQLKEKQEQEITALGGVSTNGPDPKLSIVEFNDDDSSHSQSPEPTTVLDDDDAGSIKGKICPLHSTEPANGLAHELRTTTLSDLVVSDEGGPRKKNRQKERLARRAAEQEAAAIEAEKEAAQLPNWKRQERTAMVKAFKENGLVEKEIAPDGHCMFSAVADQLSEAGVPLQEDGENADARERYRSVRKVAADYIEGHPDDFAGFLDESLGKYANKIRNTAEWGGQVELIALSKSYNVEICVIQDGRIDRFEPGNGKSKETKNIWLAYYRHGYGLGEHYNSLRKAP
jgi:OTU domain-containing protein 6